MNKIRFTNLLFCLAVCSLSTPVWLSAQATEPPEQETAATAHNSTLIEPFLLLEDHELDELIAILQRIRKMPTEQRIELANTVDRFRRMPEEQRRNLREGAGRRGQSKAIDNDTWRQMMSQLSPDQRLDVQLRLQDAPVNERQVVRQTILNEWQSLQSKAEAD